MAIVFVTIELNYLKNIKGLDTDHIPLVAVIVTVGVLRTHNLLAI